MNTRKPLTLIEKGGKVLDIKWSAKATLTDLDGKQVSTLTGLGKVLCPDCKKNTIACVIPSTIGQNINGYCNRCKKRFWFDVI